MGKGSPTYVGCLHTDEDQRCRNGPRVRWSYLPAPPPLEKRSRLPCCPPMRQPDRAECVGRSCVAPDELEERAVDLRGNRLARRMSDVVRRDGTTALDGEESPPRGDCLRRRGAAREVWWTLAAWTAPLRLEQQSAGRLSGGCFGWLSRSAPLPAASFCDSSRAAVSAATLALPRRSRCLGRASTAGPDCSSRPKRHSASRRSSEVSELALCSTLGERR